MCFYSCCKCAGGGGHINNRKMFHVKLDISYLFGYCSHCEKIFQHLYPLGRHHFTIHHFIDFSTCFVFSKALFKRSLQIKTAPTTKAASRRVSCRVACFHTDNPMVVIHCQMRPVPLLHPLYTALVPVSSTRLVFQPVAPRKE